MGNNLLNTSQALLLRHSAWFEVNWLDSAVQKQILDSNQVTNPNITSVTERATYNHTGSSYHEILLQVWDKALRSSTSALETQMISLNTTPLSAHWFVRCLTMLHHIRGLFRVKINKWGLHKYGKLERKSVMYFNVPSWHSTRTAEENDQYFRTSRAPAGFWTTYLPNILQVVLAPSKLVKFLVYLFETVILISYVIWLLRQIAGLWIMRSIF
jgi:hypothetical protein